MDIFKACQIINDHIPLDEEKAREKFEALNRVKLTDNEFKRILEQIIKPDVFKTSKTLREINTLSNIIAMKAVFSIDAKLINHLKSIFTPTLSIFTPILSIFTPILDINQCVM
jgi:hypothetical protein